MLRAARLLLADTVCHVVDVLRATRLLLAVSISTAVIDKRCAISTPAAMMLHVFHTRARTGGKFRPVRLPPYAAYFFTFRRVCCRPVTFQLLQLCVALTAGALGRVCPLYAEGALRCRSEGRGFDFRWSYGLLPAAQWPWCRLKLQQK